MQTQANKKNVLIHIRSSAMLLLLAAVCFGLSGCASMGANQVQTGATPPKQYSTSSSIPFPEAGPPPSSITPTGSLWAPQAGSLFADLRATKVGDLLTITIAETSTGSKSATTSTSKEKNSSGQASFSGLGAGPAAASNTNAAVSFGPFSTKSAATFKGDGATSKTDSMSAYMTATVVDVLPNGNLLIRGSRWTKVNDELQQLVLEGVVRPIDVSRNNTVNSQSVAEAKIFLVGKGPVSQNQKPGWLSQVFDLVNPF